MRHHPHGSANDLSRPRRRSRIVAVAIASAAALGLGVFGVTNALAASSGAITGYGGKCVDVAGASTANGTKIQLYTCNGTNAQQWTLADNGSVQALGKCMDVTAAGTANGTKVQLCDCNGTGAQQWTSATGRLVNPASASAWTRPDLVGRRHAAADLVVHRRGQPEMDGADRRATPPTTPARARRQRHGRGALRLPGLGRPPDPRTVMAATGVKWFTMAFMLVQRRLQAAVGRQPAADRRHRPDDHQQHPRGRRRRRPSRSAGRPGRGWSRPAAARAHSRRRTRRSSTRTR